MDTLLFDLDGTLLPFDVAQFMKGYFERLVPKLSGHYDPKEASAQILRAVGHVVQNEHPDLTNLEKFRKALFDTNIDKQTQVWPIFDDFYANEFEELRDLTQPSDIAREICRIAKQKNYKLVLATNPTFPAVATKARMNWAGIGDIPFDLVTTMENSHFCKPSPKYYIEVLDKVDSTPDQAMMFGNDVQEDGAAAYVGIRTYLVTDFVIDRNLGTFDFDKRGSLEDVLQYVEQLPVVNR